MYGFPRSLDWRVSSGPLFLRVSRSCEIPKPAVRFFFRRVIYPLSNRILEAFDDEAPIIQWSEDLFLAWNRVRCGDLIATFEDGEAEYLVEEEMAQLVTDLPRHELRCRISFLERCLAHARNHIPDDRGQGHRPVRIGVANKRERLRTQHSIWVAYEEQPAWQEALERAEWEVLPARGDLPSIMTLLPRPHFVIAHLFSGRRRSEDVHHFLNEWAMSVNVTVTVLSLDTAVSSYYGNLCLESCSWKRILQLFEEGVISGAIAGSPCETFSAARNQQPTPVPGLPLPRWPRPLRTARRPYGLAGLTGKEYRQLKQGSAFFLQTTLLAVWQLVHGGLFLSEHPAPPPQQHFASIWRTGLMRLLTKHPDVHLHVLQQWKWGAESQKPTGVLAIGLPHFSRDVYRHVDPSLVRPTQGAIGKEESGAFRTSKLKEYPPLFCKGLAFSMGAQLMSHFQQRSFRPRHVPAELAAWLRETALESQRIVDRSFLPDYQGR